MREGRSEESRPPQGVCSIVMVDEREADFNRFQTRPSPSLFAPIYIYMSTLHHRISIYGNWYVNRFLHYVIFFFIFFLELLRRLCLVLFITLFVQPGVLWQCHTPQLHQPPPACWALGISLCLCGKKGKATCRRVRADAEGWLR